jgi:hypothetical protein
MNTPSPQLFLDSKKNFEVLLDALKDAYKELIDLNLKIAGFLLIVIGWFASNKNPLPMLCDLAVIRYAAVIFSIAGLPALWYLFNLLANRASEAYSDLKNLGYDEMMFRRFRVTPSMLWCGLFGQFTMMVGISSLLYFKYFFNMQETCKAMVK